MYKCSLKYVDVSELKGVSSILDHSFILVREMTPCKLAEITKLMNI